MPCPHLDLASVIDIIVFLPRCLPGWTPVIGLQESVAVCNSIPPSLFLPLASLLDLGSLASQGKTRPYVPIGDRELSLWDKFKGMRGTKGQTAMLRLTLAQQAGGSSAEPAAAAMAGMPRSLRRQHQSMGNIEGFPRTHSETSMAVPHFGSPLSVTAPTPFASMGASSVSLPVSPYQYSTVPAMYYYIPPSPYSMLYPPTHYPYQVNTSYGWPATSQPHPPLQYRHSEPFLPHLFQRNSGLVPTVEETEIEADGSDGVDSFIPPASTASLVPVNNAPSASSSAPEAGNSSMGSAGIRSILSSVEADGSDSSKWPPSSDGPSMDSVIPQPSPSEDKDPGQESRAASPEKWSTSLFRIILGEDHRELTWWYYCQEGKEGSHGAVSGPWDSESMLIKVAALSEKNLDRVYACSTSKSAPFSPGSHPELSAFSRVSDLLDATK